MKIFTFIDYIGDFPNEAVAVVVANDVRQAVKLLNQRLTDDGFKHRVNKADLVPVDITENHASILFSGTE